MPPKRTPDDAQSLKAKLHDARNRRTGGANALNGSNLKEVDTISQNSGQTSIDQSSSNVSVSPFDAHLTNFTPTGTLSVHSADETSSLDQMVFTRALCAPELSKSLPTRHSLRF